MASLTGSPLFPAAAAPRLNGKEMAARLLCFGIPLMIAVEVPGMGTIYLAEFGLIGLLPVLVVLRGKALLSKQLGFILLMGLVYLGAQVLTDLIRETPFGDYARGWSRILFLLMNFVACFLLTAGSRPRIICYALGLVVGSTIYLLTHNPLNTIGWKFGFAGSTTTLMLMGFMLLPLLRSPTSLVAPMLMAALGVFSAFMDFRSWGGVLMVSAAFLSVPAIVRLFGLRPKPLSYGRMAVMGTLLLATAFAALKVYGSAAESGLLGEKSRQKYEAQSALGDLGILLGGRNESLVTVQAIMDSPLIGHGSWPKDRHYAELRQLLLYKFGFTNRFIEPEDDMIPTHSHLLGAWVEAGLGGALFWIGILGMIIAALRQLYASRDPMRPYLAFLMFLFIWDILFSPFGAQRRLTNGFLLVAMLYALKDSSMVLRSRLAPAAPLPVQESWAEQVMRPLDQRAALGLAEPEAPAWRGASPDDAEAEALDADDAWTQDPDEDDQPFDERDERFDQDSRYAPDDGAAADDDAYDIDGQEVDSEEFGENDVDADQIGGKEHGDLSGGPSDAGAGGETIRAGFRRLRQRNQ